MRAHCPGPVVIGQEDDHENEGEHDENKGEDDPEEDEFHVDEVLDEVKK